MNPRRKITVIFVIVLLASFATSAWQTEALQKLRPTASLEETLYITSPQALRRFSIGYSGLLADIYWTRAVQYFGAKHVTGARQFSLLGPLLNITTALDPHLIVAYEFGSTFLAQKPPGGAGQPDQAIALVEQGIRENPTASHLYVDLAFIYYFEKNDYDSAAKAMEEGSKIPGSHPFMKIVAASLFQRGNDQQNARLLWRSILQTTNDKMTQENALKHLRALQVDAEVPELEKIAGIFRQRTGKQPTNFKELVQAGLLPGIPLDPIGNPYRLMPDGRVEVEDYFALPFIKKGLPPGQELSIFDFSGSKETAKKPDSSKAPNP